MANDQDPARGPTLKSGPLITSAALVGGGALLTFAGFALGGSYFIAAVRRWVMEMEVPPRELARLKWAQARAAAVAGADAWQKAPVNQQARAT